MKRPVAQAKVLARIGGLAGLYGIDLDKMYGPLSLLGDEIPKGVLCTVPHTFDRIAITARVARERATAAVDSTQLARIDRLAPDAPALEIELESSGDGYATTVRAPQSRSLASLADELAALGAGEVGLERLRSTGEQLGKTPKLVADHVDSDGATSWTFHYKHTNDDDTSSATTRTRLLTVAEALAVTAAQKSIIEGLHDVLAKGGDSSALLSIARGTNVPLLAIRWQRVRFDTVIRMMLGFYPKLDAGTRLGQLAGALDADHATAMELGLGVTEPPAMRTAVAL